MIRTDQDIKKDVVNHLYWDNSIDASDVKVEVSDGRVTLTGTLPSYGVRNTAVAHAWSVGGVRHVNNLISVRFPPTFSVPSDGEMQSNVQNTLAWNPDIYSLDITVSVENGVVVLEGTVDAYWKKYTAENVATQMGGVVDVVNKLAVVPTKEISDKFIANDIEAALERNLYVNAQNITVKVEDGKVTLTGTVPSWYARGKAYDAAAYTLGVRDVQDYLTVES